LQRARREIVDVVRISKTTPFSSPNDSIPTGKIWNLEDNYTF